MNKKFHFLSINSSFSHSSLSLCMLHNAAKKLKEWEWSFSECTVAEDPAAIAAKTASLQPDLIGCSLYLFNRDFALDVLSRIHRLLPAAKIVLGGPECSGNEAQNLLDDYPFIRHVFVGEAEGIFADYLQNFDRYTARSIIAAPENGYDFWTERFPVEDEFFNTAKAFVQMETSRGCPMQCKYCTSANIPLRFKELEEVKKELAILHEKGVREVRLLDRTFNFPPQRGTRLLKIFREDFPDIEFHLEIHPQFIDDAMKAELKIAPALHIEAGVQSFDPNVQKAIGRNSSSSAVIDGIAFLTSCKNFETHADIICGLPQQTLNSLLDDVDTLIKLGPAEIQLETLKILHGTKLEKEAADANIIYSANPPYDVMQSATFKADEILYSRKLSRLLDLFYNHPALHDTFREIMISDNVTVCDFLDFMIAKGLDINRIFDLKKRVLYLADFLREKELPKPKFKIAKLWIALGYPMADVPFGSISKFDGELPCSDNENVRKIISHKETKFWTLQCHGMKINFAVNRNFKLNGAAAFFE